MHAVWYESQGDAEAVLTVGEMPSPVPGPGEVRVRMHVSGISPGDTKKRRGWLGSSMPFERVIPHSDGAGLVDLVGEGVDQRRLGERVWVFGAQSYRASGTAAQCCVVPVHQAVPLPDEVSDEVGACLGIPGITAHRAVFGDGAVHGTVVLVQGLLGAVGTMAAQLAVRDGATVIGTVRATRDLEASTALRLEGLRGVVALDRPDCADAIRQLAGGGVDRIVEVSFAENAELDATVVNPHAVIAAYATHADRPTFPFWPMLFENVTIRLLGSDDFPLTAKLQAARDLTTAAGEGALRTGTIERFAMSQVARAHDRVDSGVRGRVLLDLPG